MIGPSIHRLGWVIAMDPAVLPFSGIIPPNITVPYQLIFYNIPKLKEQKNVSRSGHRYPKYKFF